MNKSKLKSIAKRLVAGDKGILAADESSGTIEKRLNSVGVTSTESNRRTYRELLFTSPQMKEFISGVIMFDETLRQKSHDGMPFPKLLSKEGIASGIKVDKGAKDLANFPNEKVTEGLDGLRDRFSEYYKLGARFSKWRAVITMGKGIPTSQCIDANAHALARFAVLSQEANIVPIIEPEVLMSGKHTIKKHAEVTQETLKSVFGELNKYGVYLPGILLKPNMIASGLDVGIQENSDMVAKTTIKIFRRAIPKEVPGIVFLSGGLTPQAATANLNAINSLRGQPWELSFSFGRALQGEALNAWSGRKGNVDKAQKAFYKRARSVSLARSGKL